MNHLLLAATESTCGRTHALEAMVREFRLALDQMAEGLLLFDASPLQPPGPRIDYVNQGLLGLTGWAADDLVGQPLAALYAAAGLGDFLLRLPVVAQTGKRYHLDVPTRLADGGVEVFRWFLRAGLPEEGMVRRYIVALRRVAEPVVMAVAPASGEEELRAGRMEALAQVASGVAHDFNNVLAAVQASVMLAKDERDEALRATLLEHATEGCAAASTLVRRLLGFARGVGGGKRDVLDPRVVTEEAVRLASFGSNIRCELAADHDVGAVEADPVQLLQVLSNLLINARQAMPGGGTVEVEVRRRLLGAGQVPALRSGHYVQWLVRDRGHGIAPARLARIFDPFFTTKVDGTGLGLPTSLRIARDHGGTIEVRSKLGMGSEFSVFWPRAAAQPAATPPAAPSREAAVPRGSGLVLLADDQTPVREALRRQIEHIGYRVLAVGSGTEAVAAYRRHALDGQRPMAVLMDLTFPGGMTGIEAAREILAFDREAFLVACSGYLTDDAEDVPDDGFAAVLPKPFKLEDLARVMGLAAAAQRGRATPRRT